MIIDKTNKVRNLLISELQTVNLCSRVTMFSRFHCICFNTTVNTQINHLLQYQRQLLIKSSYNVPDVNCHNMSVNRPLQSEGHNFTLALSRMCVLHPHREWQFLYNTLKKIGTVWHYWLKLLFCLPLSCQFANYMYWEMVELFYILNGHFRRLTD